MITLQLQLLVCVFVCVCMCVYVCLCVCLYVCVYDIMYVGFRHPDSSIGCALTNLDRNCAQLAGAEYCLALLSLFLPLLLWRWWWEGSPGACEDDQAALSEV
jgi:hypothetical protein